MSEVTICNLALSHLGDTATVASIRPPEGSVQAQLCARFYYIARNSLLEMGTWSFSMRRVLLALESDPIAAGGGSASSGAPGVPTPWPPSGPNEAGVCQTQDGCARPWRFAYAAPGDMLTALVVQDQNAPGDYEAWFGPEEMDHSRPYPQGYLPEPGVPVAVPQPFEIESTAGGAEVILTNVPDAVLRYTALVEDTTKFGYLFSMALSYLLASMLAGPILKGEAGIQAAEQQLQLFEVWKGRAAASDANQRKTRLEAAPSWIRGR